MKIIFKLLPLTVLFLCIGMGQVLAQSVSGVVTDESGEALIGASVLKKGSLDGTVTDIDGSYTIDAVSGDVLTFSYVGLRTVSMTVGSEGTLNVVMEQDATTFSDIVVTATRTPVRKIRTTTAITTISAQELESIQPESLAEALVSTPGVTVDNSQGRKSNYNIRGFPSGNTYVTTLYEGLPLNGFASRSAGTNEYIALDRNIERVEVVRGSGATLFGRAAGAGAVNMIAKSGGDEFGGEVSFTMFNNVMGDGHPNEGSFDYRMDFNLSGPLSDNIKYSIGGYLMEDAGYKEWAIKDQGGQVSANIDFKVSDRVDIRLYGIVGNNQFNNLTDSPYDIGRGELAEGWTNANTFYPDNSQLNFNSTLRTSVFAPIQFTAPILDVNGNPIVQNQAFDNREEVDGGMAGITANIDLGKGWTLSQKIRTSSYNWRDHNEITFSSFYTAQSNILRLNANSIGDIRDFINETRFTVEAGGPKASHTISFGMYNSSAKYDRFGGLHWYTSNVDPRPTYSWFGPPGTPPPAVFTLSGTTSHQEESVTAFFLGDEMSFNDRLNVNVGIRFDRMTGFFNNDPEAVGGIDYDPAMLDENEIDFEDFSWSIGANYLLNDRSAIYGSFVRAFSLPSVGLATPIPEKNEIVYNSEIGFRFGIGDLGADIGVFNTVINNRNASVFDPQATGGQTFVTRPVGTNTVQGAEIQLTFAPSAIKGLLLRTSYTLQSSEYDGLQIGLDKIDHDRDPDTPTIPEADTDNLFGLDLVTLDAANDIFAIDVTGNQVHNTPTSIFSFNVGYNVKNFGIGFDMVSYMGRYATALNLIETPDFTTTNANISYRFGLNNGNGLKLGLRIKNLLDSSNPQQYVLGSTNDTVLVQKQRTPNFDGQLGFATVQIPRRLLFTISYDF